LIVNEICQKTFLWEFFEDELHTFQVQLSDAYLGSYREGDFTYNCRVRRNNKD